MSAIIDDILTQVEELINQKIEYHIKARKNLLSNELAELFALRATLITNQNRVDSGSGGGSGGTTGGATATKQDEQTAKLDNLEAGVADIAGNFFSTSSVLTGGIVNIQAAIGDKTDSAAIEDNPIAASLIELFKRYLLRFTTLLTAANNIYRYISHQDLNYLDIYNRVLVLTNADTVYSIDFLNCKRYAIKILSGGNVRYNYGVNTGLGNGTYPYYTLEPGIEDSDDFGDSFFTGNIYFASSVPNTVLLIKTIFKVTGN